MFNNLFNFQHSQRFESNQIARGSASQLIRRVGQCVGLVTVAACGLLLSGCGASVTSGSGTSTSSGNISATPSPVDFGTVGVGNSATSTVSVVNSSSDPVSISQIAVSGDPSFSLAGKTQLPLTVPAGGSVNLTVVYNPTSASDNSGQMTITSNSTASPTALVKLHGKGLKGTLPPSSGSAPTLGINASNIAFGNVSINSAATQGVTLTSTGTAAVTISSYTVTGSGFSLSGSSNPITLNPGATATINVQFSPTTAGAATGQLTINSNSSTNGTAVVSLTGTGTAHKIALTWSAPSSSSDPVTGYKVYRAPSGSSSYQVLNSSATTQTQYTDSTPQSSTTYQYYVTSVDASGAESMPSNTATVAIP
jgi:hypothetical protein